MKFVNVFEYKYKYFYSKKSMNTEYFMNTQKMYSNSIRIRIQNTITPSLMLTNA